jgi:hypothetical protein
MKAFTLAFCLMIISASCSRMLKSPVRVSPPENRASKKILARELAALPNGDPRKLLLSFSWNSDEKRYVQRERMKEMMKNSLKNTMEKYQFEAHLDQWNHETLEDIHRQYNKAKSNIQLAKHFLVEKMDNIYNNFIQPARWFY